jgi:hypothetical protein
MMASAFKVGGRALSFFEPQASLLQMGFHSGD